MKHSKRNPGLWLLALSIVAVLMFVLGTVGRLWGLQDLRATIQDETGDSRFLEPFSFTAYTLFQAENAVAECTLKEGQLTGKTQAETAMLPSDAQLPDDFRATNLIAVAPEERDTVNASVDFNGDTAFAKARKLWVMRELELPDGTYLRFHLADYQCDTGATVLAYPGGRSGLDWELVSNEYPEEFAAWIHMPTAEWNEKWYIGIGSDSTHYPCGIWCVEKSLTEEEIEALPTDGAVQYGDNTLPVVCETTEYGDIQLFYQPQNLSNILECVPVGQFLGVVYLDTDQSILFDLVDENAKCIQTVTLLEQAGEDPITSCTKTQKADQVCFSLGKTTEGERWIALLRADEQGNLETILLPGDLLQNGNRLAGSTLTQLSEDGQSILFVNQEQAQVQVQHFEWDGQEKCYSLGYRMTVYDLAQKEVLYSGMLDTGVEKYWGRYLGNSNIGFGLAGELLTVNRDCYTIFSQKPQEG